MSKKHVSLLIVFNIFLVFFGCIIIWWVTQHKIATLWASLASTMGNKVNDASTSTLSTVQSALIQAISVAKKSVVGITISKDVKFYVDDPSQLNAPGNIQQQTTKTGWWSGIIVDKRGYIITNKHVVQDTTAKYSVTLTDGKSYNVDKIWFDELLDIALLKIVDADGKSVNNLFPATFLSLDTPVLLGQIVLAIGNSLSDYANNVTLGIIWWTNKRLTINKNNTYIWLYQTDALVNPGNSGGPLLDIQGNVLGITTAITQWEGVAFALPISKQFIESTIKSIETFGNIRRPIMGIQYVDTASGIIIKDVIADLPAAQAGLLVGDIVVGVNTQSITNQLPFLYQLYTYIPGDTIILDIFRNNKKLVLSVVLWWNVQ